MFFEKRIKCTEIVYRAVEWDRYSKGMEEITSLNINAIGSVSNT